MPCTFPCCFSFLIPLSLYPILIHIDFNISFYTLHTHCISSSLSLCLSISLSFSVHLFLYPPLFVFLSMFIRCRAKDLWAKHLSQKPLLAPERTWERTTSLLRSLKTFFFCSLPNLSFYFSLSLSLFLILSSYLFDLPFLLLSYTFCLSSILQQIC